MGTIQRKIGASVERKTAAFTAVAGGFYLCNTVGGSFTATLPSGTAQDIITFSDDARTWGTVNLIIAPATGETIDGLAANETLVCDLTGAFVTLTWNGTTWTIATNGFASSVSNGSLSSGSGSGSKNYILNTNSSTNWAASDAGVLVADETTAGNLPDNSTQTTALRITRVSGNTAYARYRFALDQADYGKKFQLSFDMRYAGAAGDYKLEIYSFTSNAYSGGTLITPQTTDIPNMSVGGTFTTTVDMPGAATPYIEFRVRVTTAAGTTPLYLNSVYAGPGIITQGAAVSEWQSYPPTITNLTTTSAAGRWRRVGDSMEVRIQADPNGAASGTITFSIPSGHTINTTALTGTSITNTQLGTAFARPVNGATAAAFAGAVTYSSTTAVAVYGNDQSVYPGGGANWGTTTPATWAASGDTLILNFTVPIAEWAGSGTVNLGAGAQVEFAFNSSTSTSSSDTTSFAYGPAGAQIQNLANAVQRRVRFQYPIQADDQIIVEVSEDRVIWTAVDTVLTNVAASASCGPYTVQNTNDYGLGRWKKVNTTDIDVYFGAFSFPSGATFGASGQTWATGSGSFFWRVRKAKASSPVGFGLAGTDGSSGLVAPYSATGIIASGRYTPILTNVTNIASSTARSCHYTRVGKTVTVSGILDCTTAAAALTLSQIDVSLPIASNLGTIYDLAGSGNKESTTAVAAQTCIIYGNAASDRASVSFNSTETAANRVLTFTFQYEII